MLGYGLTAPVLFIGAPSAGCLPRAPQLEGLGMRNWRQQRGQQGEQLAMQFLQRQGYRIAQQNYRCRSGEIDIIAWDGTTLVFVEVKMKGQTAFGMPQAMVHTSKQQKIVQVAMAYVQQYRLQDVSLRFDVIAILSLPGAPPEVTHVRDAFTPSAHFLY